MNSTKKIPLAAALAAAVLLGAGRMPAQSAPPSTVGLIGHRQAGFDLTYDNYNSTATRYTIGTAAVVNLPVNGKIDLSFGYDLSHTTESDHGLNHNALHATVLTYEKTEYGNAYFAGTLGQRWDRLKTFGVLSRNDDAFWAASAGYEIPMGAATAINAGLTYRADFQGSKTTLQYRVEANHWFSNDFAGVISASYNQVSKAPDTLLYTAGLRWAF